MLTYYDLRAMLLSMTIGIAIVAAMLACRWAEQASQHAGLASTATAARAAPAQEPLDDISMQAPSFDGAEMVIVAEPNH